MKQALSEGTNVDLAKMRGILDSLDPAVFALRMHWTLGSYTWESNGYGPIHVTMKILKYQYNYTPFLRFPLSP